MSSPPVHSPAPPGGRPLPRVSSAIGVGAAIGSLLAWMLAACGPEIDPSSPSPHRPGDAETSDLLEELEDSAFQSAPRFGARREIPLPGKPAGVLVEDLDGDGWSELVALLVDPGALCLWKGHPQGISPRAKTVPTAGYPLGPVAIRGKGKRGSGLIAVASRATSELAVFEPAGLRPGTPVLQVPLPSAPRALAAGDLYLDGEVEIAVATETDELCLFDLEGRLLRVFPLEGKRTTALHFAEDGSGLTAAFHLEGDLHSYPSATLVDPETPVPAAAFRLGAILRDLHEADLDGDGDGELVVIGGEHDLWIFGLGANGGSVAWMDAFAPAPRRLETPGAAPVDVTSSDLDGDGLPELLLVHHADSSYGVMGGFGPGRELWVSSEAAGQTPWSASSGDIDGDGRPDIVVSNRDASRLSLLSGTGAVPPLQPAFVQASRGAVGANPVSALAVDLDSDGYPELVSLDAGTGTMTVLHNESGKVGAAVTYPVGPSPRALRAADVDGDGLEDLAFLLQRGEVAELAVYRSDGAGGLTNVPLANSRPVRAGTDLLARDFTGDGRADFVLADAETGCIVWVENTTTARGKVTTSAPRMLGLELEPRALAALRFGSSERPDVAVVCFDRSARTSVELFRVGADGLERLEPEVGTPLQATGVGIAASAADFDGDGEEDLALLVAETRASLAGTVCLFLRSGASFSALAAYPCGLGARAVRAGDIDGDGRDDLVVAAQASHHLNVWLARSAAGHGSRVSFERLPDLGAGLGPVDVHIADLDADGRLDLLVANAFSHDLSILANDEPPVRQARAAPAEPTIVPWRSTSRPSARAAR